ncbi:MAG: hypothetical protein RL022_1211 [Chloroflexota bacterium]
MGVATPPCALDHTKHFAAGNVDRQPIWPVSFYGYGAFVAILS